jgi:large subunit ribosomal protein L29
VTAKELEDRSDAELVQRLSELKAELFTLRFQHAAGQLENPIRLRDVRRDIARVMTVQHMRELGRRDQGAAAQR